MLNQTYPREPFYIKWRILEVMLQKKKCSSKRCFLLQRSYKKYHSLCCTYHLYVVILNVIQHSSFQCQIRQLEMNIFHDNHSPTFCAAFTYITFFYTWQSFSHIIFQTFKIILVFTHYKFVENRNMKFLTRHILRDLFSNKIRAWKIMLRLISYKSLPLLGRFEKYHQLCCIYYLHDIELNAIQPPDVQFQI